MSEQTAHLGDLSAPRIGARASRNRALDIVYGATFAIVVAMVMIPLVALVYGSFRTAAPGLPGEWTLNNYAGLASSGVLTTVGTTLWMGVTSAPASPARNELAINMPV